MTKFRFTLYVTGRTERSERAIRNLQTICRRELGGKFEMQVIDIMKHPQIAEDRRIMATPTLIKELPPPLKRVIGDLSDHDNVLLGLDITPSTSLLGLD